MEVRSCFKEHREPERSVQALKGDRRGFLVRAARMELCGTELCLAPSVPSQRDPRGAGWLLGTLLGLHPSPCQE